MSRLFKNLYISFWFKVTEDKLFVTKEEAVQFGRLDGD